MNKLFILCALFIAVCVAQQVDVSPNGILFCFVFVFLIPFLFFLYVVLKFYLFFALFFSVHKLMFSTDLAFSFSFSCLLFLF
jgi:hypothetical protein